MRSNKGGVQVVVVGGLVLLSLALAAAVKLTRQVQETRKEAAALIPLCGELKTPLKISGPENEVVQEEKFSVTVKDLSPADSCYPHQAVFTIWRQGEKVKSSGWQENFFLQPNVARSYTFDISDLPAGEYEWRVNLKNAAGETLTAETILVVPFTRQLPVAPTATPTSFCLAPHKPVKVTAPATVKEFSFQIKIKDISPSASCYPHSVRLALRYQGKEVRNYGWQQTSFDLPGTELNFTLDKLRGLASGEYEWEVKLKNTQGTESLPLRESFTFVNPELKPLITCSGHLQLNKASRSYQLGDKISFIVPTLTGARGARVTKAYIKIGRRGQNPKLSYPVDLSHCEFDSQQNLHLCRSLVVQGKVSADYGDPQALIGYDDVYAWVVALADQEGVACSDKAGYPQQCGCAAVKVKILAAEAREASPTPTPTSSPISGGGCKPCPGGGRKAKNTTSFDCQTDGRNLADYAGWKDQYQIIKSGGRIAPAELYGDFNCDGRVDLKDGQLWLDHFVHGS